MSSAPRHVMLAVVLAFCISGPLTFVRQASAAGKPRCETAIRVAHKGLGGADTVTVSKSCGGGDDDASPPARTLVCGAKGTKSDAPLTRACGDGKYVGVGACVHTVNGTPTVAVPFATAPIDNKGKLGAAHLWCPGDTVPADALDAMRAEAIRLLPHVQIGLTWTTDTLVNVETVLWAATPRQRDLPAAIVLGSNVRLRITFATAKWDFGDGTTEQPTTPGRAYDNTHDPCRTAQCADYYGHTYLDTGQRTITLTVTWTAEFSLDAGTNWTPLDDPVTGTTATHDITVKQARGVLVPNPGDH